MKPIDPRLLRYARATRFFLVAVVGLGAVGAGLVVAQATLIAEVVVGAFQHGMPVGELGTPLLLLAAVAVGRALVGWLTELAAHRASAAVKSELRGRLLERATALGPGWLSGQRTGSLVTLATRGVDALDDYFSRYLPQLGLAVVVPVAVLARIVTEDWVSAAIIVGTLPLIPIFMVLIGWVTQSRMDRQWLLLSRLSGHFLDVVAGLPTLKVFGRARAQAESIRRITAEYRRATMRTLRIAFISSFALELLATLSVALVAVTIVTAAALVGVQAVAAGRLDGVALAVVVLTPLAAFEAVLGMPLAVQYRQRVRRSAERVYEVLDAPVPVREPERPRKAPASPFPLVVKGLTARYAGQDRDALAGLDLTLERGRRIAVVGPSGSGKTTLAQVLLRFLDPGAGSYTLAGVDAYALDGDDVRRLVGLCAQDAHLFDSTVRENLLLARRDATEDELRGALARARLLEWADSLPDGLDTLVGEHGARLSGGQRQRLALARALLADFPVLVLDEPAEHLDLPTADALTADLLAATEGRTTLLVTHRLAGLEAVDEVVVLDGGRVVQRGPYAELAGVDGALRSMVRREAESDLRAGARWPGSRA
ncbi:ATP-binding cassette subfamily C protein CydCD OS=Streptomyces griseomycini OX=66895 GN=FHS37_001912 PE=4 SV=1 [Streptomyces griseomycini]